MMDRHMEAALLSGLVEARDVLESRIYEIEERLKQPEELETALESVDPNAPPQAANAAKARQAYQEMRHEWLTLGGTGMFSKTKLAELRRRKAHVAVAK